MDSRSAYLVTLASSQRTRTLIVNLNDCLNQTCLSEFYVHNIVGIWIRCAIRTFWNGDSLRGLGRMRTDCVRVNTMGWLMTMIGIWTGLLVHNLRPSVIRDISTHGGDYSRRPCPMLLKCLCEYVVNYYVTDVKRTRLEWFREFGVRMSISPERCDAT